MLGCINLLKEARLGKPLLAILTEFGEEFSGKREIISRILENWAQPMSSTKSRELKVIPADIHQKHGHRDTPIYDPQNKPGKHYLAPNSPGYDAGEIIPNFNDNYTGKAPDTGAYEANTPPVQFGTDAY